MTSKLIAADKESGSVLLKERYENVSCFALHYHSATQRTNEESEGERRFQLRHCILRAVNETTPL